MQAGLATCFNQQNYCRRDTILSVALKWPSISASALQESALGTRCEEVQVLVLERGRTEGNQGAPAGPLAEHGRMSDPS